MVAVPHFGATRYPTWHVEERIKRDVPVHVFFSSDLNILR